MRLSPPTHDTPHLLSLLSLSWWQNLDTFVSTIMNKPKPKPAAPAPKEEPKKEESAPKEETTEPTEKKEADMDVEQ
jgi:ribosomal protein L12E/L44/L45/RPP1/RPP2